jgi:hypothetical protein
LLIQSFFVHNDADLNRKVKTEIADQLKPIQGEMGKLREDIVTIKAASSAASNIQLNAPKTLSGFRELNGKQFAALLPSLRAFTQQPISSVTAAEPTLRMIAQKLKNTDENIPGYWPTVLQFISFLSSKSIPKVPSLGIPNIIIGDNSEAFVAHEPVEHQIVKLDGGELGHTVFRECRIIFTGRKVRMRDVNFIDCVFEVPVDVPPTSFMKQAARELLVFNLTSIPSA